MKKITLLALAMFIVSGLFAQFNQSHIKQVAIQNEISTVDMQKAEKSAQAFFNQRNSSSKAFGSRWYNYAFTRDAYLQGLSEINFYNLFPDTTMLVQYSDGPGITWTSGLGITLDPTSDYFELVDPTALKIDASMPYTLDSIGFYCVYFRDHPNTSIVDTLVFEIITSNMPGNMPIYYFTGMLNDYGIDTVRFAALTHTTPPLDTTGKATISTLNGANVITYKYPLDAAAENDTLMNGINYFDFAVPGGPLLVDTNGIFAVTIQFKPGYTWNSYVDTLHNFNRVRFLSYEERGADTYPVYNSGDWNCSHLLKPECKYLDPQDSSWYGFYIPTWAFVQGYGFENHWVDFLLSVQPDNTPPTFIATYPKATNVTNTSLSLEVQLDEPGTVYYLVVPDGNPAPTIAQVKAGSISINVTAANTTSSMVVPGLTLGTAYDIYLIAEDDETPPNVQATLTKLDVTTSAVDIYPPVFITTYPKAANVTTTGMDVVVQLDEPGTVYYLVKPNGAPAPTIAQVKAGVAISVAAASASYASSITGLTHNTSYNIYFIAEDDETPPNTQITPEKLDVTTLFDGIEDLTGKENSYEIYPNPVKDVINIKSIDKEINSFSIVNIIGKKVLDINSVKSNFVSQDVSFLSEGIYFIQIKDDNNQIFVKKLLITR